MRSLIGAQDYAGYDGLSIDSTAEMFVNNTITKTSSGDWDDHVRAEKLGDYIE